MCVGEGITTHASYQAFIAATGSAKGPDEFSWSWRLSLNQERALERIRADLEGATLRAPIIVRNSSVRWTSSEVSQRLIEPPAGKIHR